MRVERRDYFFLVLLYFCLIIRCRESIRGKAEKRGVFREG